MLRAYKDSTINRIIIPWLSKFIDVINQTQSITLCQTLFSWNFCTLAFKKKKTNFNISDMNLNKFGWLVSWFNQLVTDLNQFKYVVSCERKFGFWQGGNGASKWSQYKEKFSTTEVIEKKKYQLTKCKSIRANKRISSWEGAIFLFKYLV